MNHFTSDDRYFAKHYTQYGMIPTDKELPYKASENSACGKYVHPDDDNNSNKKHNMKKRVRLTESKLNRVVKESVNKIIFESSFPTDLSKEQENSIKKICIASICRGIGFKKGGGFPNNYDENDFIDDIHSCVGKDYGFGSVLLKDFNSETLFVLFKDYSFLKRIGINKRSVSIWLSIDELYDYIF